MILRLAVLVLTLALLGGCARGPSLPACPTPASTAAGAANVEEGYHLASGDRVRVTVFRHPDLSGEFALDGQGTLALPLIGDFPANQMTTRQLKDAVEARFREQGYLVDPRVSIDVLTYRPFYILGEVARPGEYEYKDGMIVTTAAALAGGFGYRANQDRIWIERRAEGGSCAVTAQLGTPVLPGDTVNVPERFF